MGNGSYEIKLTDIE